MKYIYTNKYYKIGKLYALSIKNKCKKIPTNNIMVNRIKTYLLPYFY